MNRRGLLSIAAAAAAWPLTLRAQQKAMPVIGFLGNSTAALEARLVESFREGLRHRGYDEGRNILIEYRWAESRIADAIGDSDEDEWDAALARRAVIEELIVA